MMHKNDERGIALVLALFLMSALSVLGASLMFLSQTETYASMNYRMMSQARYAGEAGVQKAANFLLDSTQYTIPTNGGADDLAFYDRTKSPVLCLSGCAAVGQPVVLSWDDADANYPLPAVQAAFKAAAQGTLAAGDTDITYNATATLIAMQSFTAYGGTLGVVQTWEITGTGGLTGSRNATVEVEALVETPKVPANQYAAFATAPGCGAITFQGNVTVDSYDSSAGTPAATTEAAGGDVGTNGNLTISGSVAVQGNLYTPRTGVGSCVEGAITALTETGNADVTGSIVQLPKSVVYPPPGFSVTPPTNVVTTDAAWWATAAVSGCSSLGLTAGTNCTLDLVAKTITVDGGGLDVTMPSVVVDVGTTIVFAGHNGAGNNVNINSLTGGGAVEIAANMTGPLDESVVLKVAGMNPDATEMVTPFDLSTMSWKQNSPAASYDASALQIVYGGHATISMQGGNSQSAATIYAPNATFVLTGTQDLYGSILAASINVNGNANIHYDRNLSSEFWVSGQPMVGTFTWNRF